MATTFIVVFKDGKTQDMESTGRSVLIEEHFGGDESKFKSEVKMLRWHQGTVQYTEDVQTGKIESSVQSADTNPYGWRNEAEDEGQGSNASADADPSAK